MSSTSPRKPHHPHDDAPDPIEPDSLPVAPDKGPMPNHIPDDPELDRVVNPED